MARQSSDVSGLVEHLFREEAGKMVATLARIFGVEHLTRAEDVVQEALARALQTWPFYGVPMNPFAWIMRAARNLALDVVRRRKLFQSKQAEIIQLMDGGEAQPDEAIFSDAEIADDRMRLMFVCCHPAMPVDARVALTLKTLCGFGLAEINRAFLTTEAAIAKCLTRAKQKIREAQIPFEIPAGAELGQRLDAVLKSIYLLFTRRIQSLERREPGAQRADGGSDSPRRIASPTCGRRPAPDARTAGINAIERGAHRHATRQRGASAAPQGTRPRAMGQGNDRARHVSFRAVGGWAKRSARIIWKRPSPPVIARRKIMRPPTGGEFSRCTTN